MLALVLAVVPVQRSTHLPLSLAPVPPVADGTPCPALDDPQSVTAEARLDADGREVVEVRFEGTGVADYLVLRRDPDEALFRREHIADQVGCLAIDQPAQDAAHVVIERISL